MTYTETQDGSVTLEMTREDYNSLLVMLGFALGAVSDRQTRLRMLRFVNELNRTNPQFTPYEVGS